MLICKICFWPGSISSHYGGNSCKACAMAFFVILRPRKRSPVLNLNIVIQLVKPSELCRKCRIDRCAQVGMKWPIPKELDPNKPFEDEKFPIMSEVAKEMSGMMRKVEHNLSNKNVIRGTVEEGSLFIGMLDFGQIQQRVLSEHYQTMSNIGIFKQIELSSIVECYNDLSNYQFIDYYYRGIKYGKYRQESSTRNSCRLFLVPDIYIDLSFAGFYTWAQRSLPQNSTVDWENIAKYTQEIHEAGEYFHALLEHLTEAHEDVLNLCQYLVYVNRTIDCCQDSRTKDRIIAAKSVTEAELEAYFKDKKVDANKEIKKIKELLECIKCHGTEVGELREYVRLHFYLAAVKTTKSITSGSERECL